MKIDTTVTIPQLSQLSAERAEVAGPGLAFDDIFSLASARPHEKCENFPTPAKVSEQRRTAESTSDSAVDPTADTDVKPTVATSISKHADHQQDAQQVIEADHGTTDDTSLDQQRKPAEIKKPADDLTQENVVTPIQIAPQPVVVEQPNAIEQPLEVEQSKLRREDSPAVVPAKTQDVVPATTASLQPQTQSVVSVSTMPTASAGAVSSPTIPATSTRVCQSSQPQLPASNTNVNPAAATKTETALTGTLPNQDAAVRAVRDGETQPSVVTAAVSPDSTSAAVPVQENPQSNPDPVPPNEMTKVANELPAGETRSVKDAPEEASQVIKAQVESASDSTTEAVLQPKDQTQIDARPAAFTIAIEGVRAGLAAFRQLRHDLKSSSAIAFPSTGGVQKWMSLVDDSIPELAPTKSAPASSIANKFETFAKSVGMEFGAPQHTQVQESTSQATTGPLDSVAAPVPMESFVHRMTEIVQQRLEGAPEADKSSVVLRLDPPDLGRLNVHVSISNEVVSIRMVATDEAARQAIERQLGNLHQSLGSYGVAFTPCQVECQTQGQNSSNQTPFQQRFDDIPSTPFGQPRNPLATAAMQAYARSRSALDYVA